LRTFTPAKRKGSSPQRPNPRTRNCPDKKITLEEGGPEPSGPGEAHFGLLVDDVDTAHRRALGAGAAEIQAPMDFAWKPRTSCVRDPSGNLIDLNQS
jgi:predicted enzyme related to lactoylglutathione lyase